ncbi:UNVERIFIED_CONTAM: hypothetical protein HDU68_001972 [Siphonaria sp. JEL0065]|nr:hypothetical protein HDU68_001972 [Siphonaria sp. JEL0065]
MTIKTVVITGTSRGIGRTLAKHFVSLGWNVVATARDASTIADLNGAKTFALDVASEASIAAFAKKLGPQTPVHLLVNNAGVFVAGSLGDLTLDVLAKQFTTNAFGPILTAQALLPNLRLATSRDSPAFVVNVSSVMGSIAGNDGGKYYGYRGSKAALNALSKSLSIDLKPENIGVLLFHPGYVKTDMAPAGTISQDESVAGMTKTIDLALKDASLGYSGEFYSFDGRKIAW